MIGIGAGPAANANAAAGPALDPLRLEVDGLRPDLWPRNGVITDPDPAPAPFTPVRIINTGGEPWHRCNMQLTRALEIGETVWIRVRTADGTSANRRIGPMGPDNAASLITGPLTALEVTRQELGPLTLVEHTPLPDGAADLVLRFECAVGGVTAVSIGPEADIEATDMVVWACQVTTERSGWLIVGV